MEVEKINLRNQFDQGSKNLEQKFTTFFLIKFSKFSKNRTGFRISGFQPEVPESDLNLKFDMRALDRNR